MQCEHLNALIPQYPGETTRIILMFLAVTDILCLVTNFFVSVIPSYTNPNWIKVSSETDTTYLCCQFHLIAASDSNSIELNLDLDLLKTKCGDGFSLCSREAQCNLITVKKHLDDDDKKKLCTCLFKLGVVDVNVGYFYRYSPQIYHVRWGWLHI